jgi:uncharacterized protein YkwD
MRSLVAAACTALVAAAAAPAAVPAEADAEPATAHASSAERGIVRLINRLRARHGLRPLRSSTPLAQAADHHSRDMLAHEFLAHHSSDGTPFALRVRRFAPARRVGENVAVITAAGDPAQVVDLWLQSPPHRAVLLSPRFRRIGVALRSGVFGGHAMEVFTADFASTR